MDVTKRLVLYADDDADDLYFVSESLSLHREELELKTFMDGGQILTYIEKLKPTDHLPCLIILDFNMPVVSGKEVLFRLREKEIFKDIPIVVFTTSSHSFDKEFAEKYNAVFRVKPLHLDQMKEVVTEFLSYCALPKERSN
jgi:CheY-like chemotaxis protein